MEFLNSIFSMRLPGSITYVPAGRRRRACIIIVFFLKMFSLGALDMHWLGAPEERRIHDEWGF